MRHRSNRLGLAAATLAGSLWSCDTVLGPAPIQIPNARPYTTGAALAALDSEGRFRLPVPKPAIPGDSVVEAARAAALATAYVRTYTITGLPWQMHGGSIDWSDVVVDEARPAYFAQGLYAAIADTFPAAFDRAFGPQYIVPLYLGDVAVASVSVAARTTDLRIDSAGVLIVPDDRVNDGSIFLTFGIPQNAEFSLPISPERAAQELSLATGAKIAEVPILWQPRVGHAAPHSSRWEMVLNESIEVELISESRTVVTNTVFVSSDRGRRSEVNRGR